MRMSPLVRTLAALTVGCAALTATPVIASAATAAVHTPAKHKMKVQAAAAKGKVKKGEHTQVKGRIDDLARSNATGTETLFVQQLQAGVWVNVFSDTCRPKGFEFVGS